MHYIENNILPASTYNVLKRSTLHDEDRLVLTLLYQPIMGQCALSLYLTLWGDIQFNQLTDEYTHHRLMSLMQIDLNQFVHAKERLEALGLLRTYETINSGINNFVYELYAPLTPNDFFNNPLLNELLYNYLGSIGYKKVQTRFLYPEIKLDQYKEVTKSFKDVFEINSLNINYNGIFVNEFEDKRTNNISYINEKFDFDLLIASLPKSLINKNAISEKDKDLIVKLHSIYNINEEELKNILLQATTLNGQINQDDLKDKVRTWYQFTHNGRKLTLVNRNHPNHLKTELVDNSNRTKMIKRFEDETPYQFLKNAYNGSEPLARDLNTIEKLMIDTDLLPGVVNVLIDYVLLTNNHKLTANYIQAVASQWRIKNIQTVEEAMNIAEKEHLAYMNRNTKNTTTKISKTNSNQATNKEKVPDWFNKKIEKEEADEATQARLDSMFSKFL